MDQIALISDIHGNMPALEAALADIAARGIARIICLGDLVGKGPGPAEVIDRVRTACEAVVPGNWDVSMAMPQEQAHGLWQQSQLLPDQLDYLAGLPYCVDMTISGRRMRLFHASAVSVFHRVNRKASKAERLAMFDNTAATGVPQDGATPDVVGYGDIHLSYLRTLERPDTPTGGLTLFNTGSIGIPYDGIPQASYCIVEGIIGADQPSPLGIQFVRVPYDVEEAVRLARDSDMPDAELYILEIMTARVHK
ncbi:metallophosphoesterase [Paenibacillus athensensis]|uniref:Metallophosphatase family protein n=1 Tax=Paenibacillus athensensis TaxID=1967502 RepID=A0A4Y8QA89_9BACL|nr:metallophosphoesterase family protein [Paenibacillus athensensis]MCD1259028.1 metallophosphoesterase [Paenibacillus athensensis]